MDYADRANVLQTFYDREGQCRVFNSCTAVSYKWLTDIYKLPYSIYFPKLNLPNLLYSAHT